MNPHIQITKVGTQDNSQPRSFRVTDSHLLVSMPGASGFIVPDNAFSGNTRLTTTVSQRMFDALDFPCNGETKTIDFGNGLAITVMVSPIGGMTKAEMDALTDEEWVAHFPEPDMTDEEREEIERAIAWMDEEDRKNPPPPRVDL